MKKRLTLIIFITFLSCSKEQKLENLNGIFSEIEFQELTFLLRGFDDVLLEESQTYSTKIAYWEFSQRVFENSSVPIIKGIDSLSNLVLQYKVFDKIWWKYQVSKSNKYKYNFSKESRYLEYLRLVGKKKKFIKSYAESLELTSDLLPSVVAGFAKNIKKTDLDDENIRLIFAIHYLTLLNR
ncbi:hypothetical protein [Algibacter sp. R77976]|uniref:hypothetical protein n=1 Tax=Algibacter sp. R77976 TaxID=3093873 RepID=UPI0037CB29A2